MGRKEVRTFLKQFSLVTACTGGDDVRKAEANTEGIESAINRETQGQSARRDSGRPVGVREHGTEKEKR